MINVVLLRGLLGHRYSRGMDSLGAKLAKLPNVDYVTVEDYTQWRRIAQMVSLWADPTVLIGHSFGANAATLIARRIKSVPLLVAVDPSQHFSLNLMRFGPAPLSKSVQQCLNFYQASGLIGRVQIGGADNIRIAASHVSIDDRTEVHDAVIEAVKELP